MNGKGAIFKRRGRKDPLTNRLSARVSIKVRR
jgi:hypothetical protein